MFGAVAVTLMVADDRLPGEPGAVLRYGWGGLRGGRGLGINALQGLRTCVSDPTPGHLGPQGLQARGKYATELL